MLCEKNDLDIARGLYKNQPEKCEQFVRSIHKLRESHKKYNDKREKSKIVFLDIVPDKHIVNRHKNVTCQAITMSGKRCSFKSTCGIYCKKHNNSHKK
jgi:hypothetical protein